MFKKILIANRGEIACRVIQTARRMGIATVAVYSDADARALHVRLADEAVNIGPGPSAESYLNGELIIDVARRAGAEAIHPGYGFLSENPDFARAVEQRGIVFVGPKHEAIAAMGDKIASKRIAEQAGVNVIPGFNEAIADAERAVRIAADIGYPVMIKASAGGGGKGLRIARDDREALEAFASCQSEAKAAFGDDRIFIEKFIEQPRHIEIQILADAHGNVVHLFERDCSMQRRHQKVLEEAPSPFIGEATRRAMGEQAVALARAVGYQSAGTVEFVVGQDESFYFLEMNTRLQVEHPVTECITGIDLVEQMLRIAAGEALGFAQEDVRRRGWAIECRINAEDPERNFLPATGRLVRYAPPETSIVAAQPMPEDGGVRVDAGVFEGGEIPIYYDSLIAKLITHGSDRNDAIERMREALNGFVIRGVASNVDFQSALIGHPDFASGRFDTSFIASHYPHGFDPRTTPHDDPMFLVALAAFVRRKARERSAHLSGQMPHHDTKSDPELVVVVLGEGGENTYHNVTIEDFEADATAAEVHVEGRPYRIRSNTRLGRVRMYGTCNARPFVAKVESNPRKPLALDITHNGRRIEALVMLPRAAELFRLMPFKPPPDMGKFLLSPMPGLLAQLLVGEGDAVRSGQRLAVVEAMKMENVLTAARDGTVAEVMATEGDNLSVDQPILRFE